MRAELPSNAWHRAIMPDACSRLAGDRASSHFFIKISPDVAGNGGIGSQMPLGRPFWDDETIERIGLWIDSL